MAFLHQQGLPPSLPPSLPQPCSALSPLSSPEILPSLTSPQDQVEAYMAAPDLRKLADPTTGWDQSKRRAGVIARKLGMVSEYTEYMQCLPTTVLQVSSPAPAPAPWG